MDRYGVIKATFALIFAVLFPVTFLALYTIQELSCYFFMQADVNDSPNSQTPHQQNGTPSYDTWLALGGMKPCTVLMADADCIVCRHRHFEAVRLSPCGHKVCSACATAWFERDKETCPQCTLRLFIGNATRRKEKTVKITSAIQLVSLVLTIFDMAFGGGEVTFIFDVLAFVYLVRSTLIIVVCRWLYGTRWWNADELDSGEMWSQILVLNCVWALFQAFVFGGTTSQHLLHQRLWKGLCEIFWS
jgi:hypothetical protein